MSSARSRQPTAAFRSRWAAGRRARCSPAWRSTSATVPARRLVDDLWGDEVPESATKMVQISVSRLRKVLPDGVLVTRPPGYALVLEPAALDLTRFATLRDAGRSALAAGDAAGAATRFRGGARALARHGAR